VRRLCREAEAHRVARWIGVYLASADSVGVPLAAYQAGDSFAAASVIKVPVMLALEARWDEPSLKHTPRLENLLQRMIRESDNEATRVLIHVVGRQRINAEVGHLLGTASPVTVLAARHRSAHHGRRRNQANPREMARLLSLISAWERSGRRAGRHMMNIMRRTAPRHRTRIPQGVPREYRGRVANKTGTLADVVDDAAVVETPSGTRYILCIFMEGVRRQGRAEEFCRSLSRYCWSRLASRPPPPEPVPPAGGLLAPGRG
jgi:beta-lactamase class A